MDNRFFAGTLVSLALCVVFSTGVNAQYEAFSKGDRVFQAAVGFGNYIDHSKQGYSPRFLPVTASLEYGILNLFDGVGAIGIGGYAGFTTFRNKATGKTAGDFIIGPRANLHYQFLEKLDTYTGIMVGFDVANHSEGTGLPGSKLFGSIYLGARYYLLDNLSVFGEIGYGIAPLEIGVAFKF